MKGTQKIVLDVEAVNEAVQEYLQKRSSESVEVIKTESSSEARGYNDRGGLKLEVTFKSSGPESPATESF